MKNHTVKIIGVFFTLFFFHSIFCYSDEVNLEEIKKAVEKRIEAANPIYVKYTNKTTYTVDYNKYLVDNPQDVSNENITFDVIMEWAQKGDKLRFSSISPELFNGRIVEQPKENLFVFDENLVVINNGSFYFDDEQHPFYKISYDKKNTKVHLNIFDLSGDTIVRRVLSSFNSQKQSCKIEKRSDTNGSNIFLNINDSGRSEKVSVWLTDDQDHLIKKLEFISGSSKDILEDITYKVINDIPVPISGKYTRFLNGKLFEERIFNVSFIELKGNKIPNSL
ncbi:MAG: hypothetical protein LBT05_11435, partial [Planctomycetaceae bacterium]|nr:hypothetical protein [Planctomycetaceae bacterium]